MSSEEKHVKDIAFEEENNNEEDQTSGAEPDEFDEFVRALDERIETLLRPVDQDGDVHLREDEESVPGDAEKEIGLEPPERQEDEVDLNELIEKMHIAYLALEWEFSHANLEKLESSIADIEKAVKLNDHALRISKILSQLIELFYQGERFVNLKSMELLKDAIQGLSKTVKREAITPEIVKSIDALEKNFQDLMSEVTPPALEKPAVVEQKEAIVEKTIEVVKPEVPVEEAVYSREVSIPPDIQPIMESLSGIRAGIEKTTGNLQRLCTKLAKKPSLRALNDYLSRLEKSYRFHLEKLSRFEDELSVVLSQGFAGGQQEKAAFQEEHGLSGQLPSEHPEKKAGPVVYEGDEIPEEYKKVFLTQIMGLYYFLPAQAVVRIAHASRKKMETILSRGYATLKDFKPFLRNIKTYLIGKWGDLSTQELKRLRFRPVDVGKPLDLGNTLQAVGGDAILLSFDYGNFIIFVDAVLSKEALDVERLEVHPEETDIAGYANAGGRRGVPVLSDKLFKKFL
ncbi:hypothetical protein [Thermodesulforhabdus norvegica]|uniref:CheW-like domain-containing protein n=1 Tax=Thermodesulforhabdus norvegica TaxID=39841 RepID=A0A1I4QMX6_9BACT|nr:hypothetical protein [Thermodesulforhabdus norvegica]SFM41055.1 hypothetical protein SAMN05660836_00107 [Thermodesulforhabdus norvegica]